MKVLDNTEDFIEVKDILEVVKEGTADNVEELKDIIKEIGENADTLIRESYFSEYIYNLVDETENISDVLSGYIDYDKLERDSKMDYYEVEIDGVNYLTLG